MLGGGGDMGNFSNKILMLSVMDLVESDELLLEIGSGVVMNDEIFSMFVIKLEDGLIFCSGAACD